MAEQIRKSRPDSQQATSRHVRNLCCICRSVKRSSDPRWITVRVRLPARSISASWNSQASCCHRASFVECLDAVRAFSNQYETGITNSVNAVEAIRPNIRDQPSLEKIAKGRVLSPKGETLKGTFYFTWGCRSVRVRTLKGTFYFTWGCRSVRVRECHAHPEHHEVGLFTMS